MYTQNSRAYLTPRACIKYVLFTRVLHFTRVYSMFRLHYKQRFKRVTRKHVTGVTIVHALKNEVIVGRYRRDKLVNHSCQLMVSYSLAFFLTFYIRM